MFIIGLLVGIIIGIVIGNFALVIKSKIMYNNLCEDIERGKHHAGRKI